MSIFEFVSVMFSIVLGLSLAQALGGVAGLIRGSNRVQTYAPHTLWLVMIVLTHFLLWWSIWDFRDVEWNYARFIVASIQPMMLFFLSAIIIPPAPPGSDVNLESHYVRVRPWLMSTYAVAMLVFIIDGPLIFNSEELWNWFRAPQVASLVATVIGLFATKKFYQTLVSAVVLGVVVAGSFFRFLPAAFTISN